MLFQAVMKFLSRLVEFKILVNWGMVHWTVCASVGSAKCINKLSLVGMQLPEKYTCMENFGVSTETAYFTTRCEGGGGGGRPVSFLLKMYGIFKAIV